MKTVVKADILKQHKEILMTAGVELATNNTNSLIEDDIINGVIEPPLEAMDVIKQRILNIAKDNKLVINSDKFNEVLTEYKNELKQEFINIFKKRITLIADNFSKFDDNKPLDLVKNLKKELVKFNKESKKEYKEVLIKLVKEKIINNLDLFVSDNNISFNKEVTKFLQNFYIKQILETIDMKILVKDTILLNSLKEQIERFVFTKENSHLFDWMRIFLVILFINY